MSPEMMAAIAWVIFVVLSLMFLHGGTSWDHYDEQ